MKAPGHGEHGGARARRAHEQQRQGLLLVADHPRRAGAAPHRRRLRIVSLLRLTTPRRRPFVHGHRLLPQMTLTRRLPLVAHRRRPDHARRRERERERSSGGGGGERGDGNGFWFG